MRQIDVETVMDAVSKLVQKANFELPEDVLDALKNASLKETSPSGKQVLEKIIENADIATRENIPLCQDCGAAVIFVRLGQEVQLVGGDFQQAINAGVRTGYQQGYLRKSMVASPFGARCNTGDNTPAVIHIEIVPGDKLSLSCMPKGGGAENMSRLVMLKPADGEAGIVRAVVAAVQDAGGNPCPPLIVGLGIGATTDEVFVLAKKALLRPLGSTNQDAELAALEENVLHEVNKTGIGPLGLGGSITALAVHVETKPCHFASLPLAINLQCHSARHAEVTL